MSCFISLDDDEFSILGAHSIHNNQAANINNVLKNEYNNYTDVLKGVKLPCEFCLKMIDAENLVLHEVNYIPNTICCLVNISVFLNCIDWMPS